MSEEIRISSTQFYLAFNYSQGVNIGVILL